MKLDMGQHRPPVPASTGSNFFFVFFTFLLYLGCVCADTSDGLPPLSAVYISTCGGLQRALKFRKEETTLFVLRDLNCTLWNDPIDVSSKCRIVGKIPKGGVHRNNPDPDTGTDTDLGLGLGRPGSTPPTQKKTGSHVPVLHFNDLRNKIRVRASGSLVFDGVVLDQLGSDAPSQESIFLPEIVSVERGGAVAILNAMVAYGSCGGGGGNDGFRQGGGIEGIARGELRYVEASSNAKAGVEMCNSGLACGISDAQKERFMDLVVVSGGDVCGQVLNHMSDNRLLSSYSSPDSKNAAVNLHDYKVWVVLGALLIALLGICVVVAGIIARGYKDFGRRNADGVRNAIPESARDAKNLIAMLHTGSIAHTRSDTQGKASARSLHSRIGTESVKKGKLGPHSQKVMGEGRWEGFLSESLVAFGIQFDPRKCMAKGMHSAVYKGVTGGGEVVIKLSKFGKMRQRREARDRGGFTGGVVPPAHKNLVAVLYNLDVRELYGAGSHTTATIDCPYESCLVMEYCSGGSLRSAIENGCFVHGGRWHMPKLAWVLMSALDIAECMVHLHSKDIVHADLTPDNVYLQPNQDNPKGFDCKVGNMELAFHLPEGSDWAQAEALGDPSHMPPELVSRGTLSKSTDVFSFGILLWELVSGQPAFGECNDREIAKRIASGERPKLQPLTPPFYVDLVKKCWHQEPGMRPNFQEIVECLNSTLIQYYIDPSNGGCDLLFKSATPRDFQHQHTHHSSPQVLQIGNTPPHTLLPSPSPFSLTKVPRSHFSHSKTVRRNITDPVGIDHPAWEPASDSRFCVRDPCMPSCSGERCEIEPICRTRSENSIEIVMASCTSDALRKLEDGYLKRGVGGKDMSSVILKRFLENSSEDVGDKSPAL